MTESCNQPHIIIVDDHPLVLEGMANTLTASGLRVRGSFQSFAALENAGGVGSSRLIVTDIKMHGEPCLRQLEKLRTAHPDLRVVGITGIDDRDILRQVIAAGFDGLVFKNESTDELIRAVFAVAEGRKHFSPEVSNLMTELEDSLAAGDGTPEVDKLTAREREVLLLVSSGLSARKIAERLHISVWTVTNHKANIMAKLGIHSQVGLTRFAIGAGIAN